MTPLAAIRSATVTAAECLGWADRVGTLRPGRFADLVAVDGRPAGRTCACSRPRSSVMKGGRLAVDRRGEVAGGTPAIAGALTPVLLGIDHLVVAVRSVEAAADVLERDLGLAVTGGGRHEAMGTYNRLAFLGDTYVELIGVFDAALVRSSPSFAVGSAALAQLEERGEGLATYALATDDVARDVARLRAAGSPIGEPVGGSPGPAGRRASCAGSARSRSWGRSGRRSSSSTRPPGRSGATRPGRRGRRSGTRVAAGFG